MIKNKEMDSFNFLIKMGKKHKYFKEALKMI